MPRISEFYGIKIYMYPGDHNPPHFHAFYAEHEAEVQILDGRIIFGFLPPRARRLVEEWAMIRRIELLAAWTDASAMRPVKRIAPLD